MIKKGKNSLLTASICFLLIFACFGCKKKELPPQVQAKPAKQIQKQTSSVKKRPGNVQNQASSAQRAFKTNNLDFTSRKDPFKAFMQPTKQQAEARPVELTSKKHTEELLPIQSYETEKFKVSGIIAGMKENRALLMDPAGKGYVVREGMLIGSNEGTIVKISNTSVDVEEKFRDEGGHVRKRLIKLTLIRKSKESLR